MPSHTTLDILGDERLQSALIGVILLTLITLSFVNATDKKMTETYATSH